MDKMIHKKIEKISKKHFNDISSRDPKRINGILGKIATIWNNSPDLRFGQLITCLREGKVSDPFYIEDDKWEEMCDLNLANNKNIDEYIVIKKWDLKRIKKYVEDINTFEAVEILKEILGE